MRQKLENVDGRWKAYALGGSVCVLVFVVLMNLGNIFSFIGGFFKVISPVIIGACVAYIVNTPARFFERRVFKGIKRPGVRWGLSVIVTLILLSAFFVTLIVLLIPQLIDSVGRLIDNIDAYAANLQRTADRIGGAASEIADYAIEYIAGEEGVITQLGSVFVKNMRRIIETTSHIGTKAVNWGVGFILAMYFLAAKRKIKAGTHKLGRLLMDYSAFDRASELMSRFDLIFSKYISCEVIDSLIVGVATHIFMSIAGLPNALIISVIVALTNLAPTFGPIVGAVLGAILLLLTDSAGVIPFLIFSLAIQTLDGYLIKPKLFGGVLKVPGVLILISIIVLGKFMGVTGMLIAIPVAAIICYLYEESFINWLERRRAKKNAEEKQEAEDRENSEKTERPE